MVLCIETWRSRCSLIISRVGGAYSLFSLLLLLLESHCTKIGIFYFVFQALGSMDFDDSESSEVGIGLNSAELESLGNHTDNTNADTSCNGLDEQWERRAGRQGRTRVADVLVLSDSFENDGQAINQPIHEVIRSDAITEPNSFGTTYTQTVETEAAQISRQRAATSEVYVRATADRPSDDFTPPLLYEVAQMKPETRENGARPPSRRGRIVSEMIAEGSTRKPDAGPSADNEIPGVVLSSHLGIERGSSFSDSSSPSHPEVEDWGQWDTRLSQMELVDICHMSRMYQYSLPGASEEERIVGLLKTIHFYPPADVGMSSHTERSQILGFLRHFVEATIARQLLYENAGLMGSSPDIYSTESPKSSCVSSSTDRAVCRGFKEIHIDSSCRLIALLDVEECSVSLSTIVALSVKPLRMEEVVAVLHSVTSAVEILHRSHLAHGGLHKNNVLISPNDGHVTLTQPGGVATNIFFPSDVSSLPPRKAFELSSVFNLVAEKTLALKQTSCTRLGERPLDEKEKKIIFLFSAIKESEKAFSGGHAHDDASTRSAAFSALDMPHPSDDVYAIGTLALLLLYGFPAFYGISLHEVTQQLLDAYEMLFSLTEAASQEDTVEVHKRNIAWFFFSQAKERASNYFQAAGYTSKFLEEMEDFITTCLLAGFYAARDLRSVGTASSTSETSPEGIPLSATALLRHKLFSAELEGEVTSGQTMTTITHRLGYGTCLSMEYIKEQCGTKPYILRFHTNSIFASRWKRSRRSISNAVTQWSNSFPLISSSARIGSENIIPYQKVRDERAYQVNECGKESGETSSGAFPEVDNRERNFFSDVVVVEPGYWVYANQKGSTLLIDEASLTLKCSEIEFPVLILAHLNDCFVEICVPFAIALLLDCSQCDFRLGPCLGSYVHSVKNCTIHMAAKYLVLDELKAVDLNFSGSEIISIHSAFSPMISQFRPYAFCYAGLSQHYSYVGLLPEHTGTVHKRCSLLHDEKTVSPINRNDHERCFVFADDAEIGKQPLDFPYHHALAASGDKFTHVLDCFSDFSFFNEELEGKTVFLSFINGSLPLAEGKEEVYPGTSWDVLAESKIIVTRPNGVHYPFICILCLVGDVTIEDCSYCTIVVLGSKGTFTLRRCNHVTTIFAAQECLIEKCTDIRAFACVTEYFAIQESRNIYVHPLVVFYSHMDTVLSSIIDLCDEEDLLETLTYAFESRDAETLNAAYGTDERLVIIDSEDVLIHHLFQQEEKKLPTLICIPSHEATVTDSSIFSQMDNWRGGELAGRFPGCNFFEDLAIKICCKKKILECFSVCSLGDLLEETKEESRSTSEGCSRANASHVLHDLVNPLILRTPESFEVVNRCFSSCSSPEAHIFSVPLAPLLALRIERIFGGEIHIQHAIKTLIVIDCGGPLDIAVCAAEEVLIYNCTNVTVRVSCSRFTAERCCHSHFALHVNEAPVYRSCLGISTSPLNMTAYGMETFMKLAHVEMSVNRYKYPLIYHGGQLWERSGEILGRESREEEKRAFDDVNELLRGVAVILPLPGLCVGSKEAPFLEALENELKSGEVRVPLNKLWATTLKSLGSQYLSSSTAQSQQVELSIDVFSFGITKHVDPSTTLRSAEIGEACSPTDDLGPSVLSENNASQATDESAKADIRINCEHKNALTISSTVLSSENASLLTEEKGDTVCFSSFPPEELVAEPNTKEIIADNVEISSATDFCRKSDAKEKGGELCPNAENSPVSTSKLLLSNPAELAAKSLEELREMLDEARREREDYSQRHGSLLELGQRVSKALQKLKEVSALSSDGS